MPNKRIYKKINVNEFEKLTDLSHLNLFAIHYLDKNNQEKTWLMASRRNDPKYAAGGFDAPDAVVIVPYHRELGKLVLIKEFRVPLGGYQYGFPAGLMDPGETVEDTARRELKEETGLLLDRVVKTSAAVYSSSGISDESVAMVFAECSGSPSNRENESSEDIETLMIAPGEAGALCARTDIKFDVKTWLVLSYYANSGWCPGSASI